MGKKDEPKSGPLGNRTQRPHSPNGWGSSPRDGDGPSTYDPNMKRGVPPKGN